MMTGRLLIMLVVMASMVATGRPALAGPETVITQELAGRSWTERLSVGRSVSRIGLLQRVAIQTPPPQSAMTAAQPARAPQPALIDAYRYCLPPPSV